MTEIAAVAGALGSVLLLAARGPRAFTAGLLVVGVAAVGVAAGSLGGGSLPVPAGGPALAGGLALVVMALGAAGLFVRYPCAAVPALLLVAPLRLPIAADSSSPLLFEFVQSGGLGRLYPLYGVLVPVVLAFAWRALRGAGFRPLPSWIAIPAAVLTALAGASMLWTADAPATADALVFFWLPFTLLLAVVAQTPVNARLVRNLAIVLVGSAAVFAAVGIWQAATHELFFYTPALELVNAHGPLFRVTSVFQDPSHFGRELVMGIAVVFVALWLDRLRLSWAVAVVALMVAGLWFSYSQSSMVSLVVVLLAVTLVAGDRASRRLTRGVCALLAVVAIAGFAYWVASGDIEDLTRERSRLVLDTGAVALDHPAGGVGLGAQARVTQAEQNPVQDIPHNASHTTPLTVAAELGAAGLLAYLALLAGTVTTLYRLREHDEALALGLGAVLLALWVHSIMYAGFFDNPVVWGAVGLAGGALAHYNDRRSGGGPEPAG